MKVLHINQSDILGGAGIAAYRLHQGLLNHNIDSSLLVGTLTLESDRISAIPRKIRLENQLSRINSFLGLNYLNIISTFDLVNHPFYQQADIINFHNLHTGYFNYLALPQLTENKQCFWILHDMWAFTGHCSYSYDCNKWKTGCGKCPYPNTPPKIKRDNTALEWKLKNWIYNNSNLSIISPSKWLADEAKKSMLNKFPIHHIPHGIDIQAYQPLDKEKCRELLGIPINKKVLLFVAQRFNDERKGGDLLLKSLAKLPESLKKDTILLILGNETEKISQLTDITSLNLGYISSDRLKSIAYSAADLFLFPTRADNQPLVLQESMACGTPMVSFNIGGVSELVRHNITGYLASPENIDEFNKGIIALLEDEKLREKMGENCRKIAVEEYNLDLQVKRYVQLYNN
jgi:glycosyltransferase involved in cell wall biosynthesis